MNKTSVIILFLGTALSLATAAAGNNPNNPKSDLGAAVNTHLTLSGSKTWLLKAECLGAPGFQGRTIYWNDRGNKQTDSHFVPGDYRRGGFLDIAWINDLSEAATANGLTPAQTDAAIGRAMATWEGVQCSTIPLTALGSFNFDFGVIQWIAGLGGTPIPGADITHAGWLPGSFFDLLETDGSHFILGVTFTFIWLDENGVPTDVDRNGKLDTAFAETYYNDAFPWGINTGFPIDVQTVALHETGHSLSQGHFGEAFATKNGKFHFAPLAVMNAGYSGVLQVLAGSDLAGHCSIWAKWPIP